MKELKIKVVLYGFKMKRFFAILHGKKQMQVLGILLTFVMPTNKMVAFVRRIAFDSRWKRGQIT
jgi:hypothetical protein